MRVTTVFFSSASHRSNKFGNAPQTHLRIGYYADQRSAPLNAFPLRLPLLTDSNGEAVAGIP